MYAPIHAEANCAQGAQAKRSRSQRVHRVAHHGVYRRWQSVSEDLGEASCPVYADDVDDATTGGGLQHCNVLSYRMFGPQCCKSLMGKKHLLKSDHDCVNVNVLTFIRRLAFESVHFPLTSLLVSIARSLILLLEGTMDSGDLCVMTGETQSDGQRSNGPTSRPSMAYQRAGIITRLKLDLRG